MSHTSAAPRRAALIGRALPILGYVVHFAFWLPHLAADETSFARSIPVVLGPYATPLMLFIGIALIGRSWLYSVASVLFVVFHVAHGLYGFGLVGAQ